MPSATLPSKAHKIILYLGLTRIDCFMMFMKFTSIKMDVSEEFRTYNQVTVHAVCWFIKQLLTFKGH